MRRPQWAREHREDIGFSGVTFGHWECFFMNEKVRKLVTMAMLAALSIVLVYVIHFPIFPAASFLE